MSETDFMPINNNTDNNVNIIKKEVIPNDFLRTISPETLDSINNNLIGEKFILINGIKRDNWAYSSDDDSEDETEQKSVSKLEKLQKNYQSISSILDESTIPTDDNFSKRITLLLIVICCRFSIQICEYRSFRTEIQDFFGFTQNKILNKKMCKNVNENKVIPKEFIPIFNAILRLVKNAIHIPCTESKISEFQMDLETDSKNIDNNIFRRSVFRAFLIECYHILMIFLHQKVEKNQTHLLKFVKFGNFDKNIAIENPDFPYDVELNKLLTTFDTLKSNTNLSLFVSIYYQIKDDLEKIVEKANLEYSQNK